METVKNAGIQKRQTTAAAKEQKSVKDWLTAYSGEISKALPAQVGPGRFQRICMTALTQNPLLGSCSPASFIGAVLNSAQLGLEPNTPLGQAYLIPYRNNKKGCYEVQFQIGYRGMIELARRSGQIAMIKAHSVRQNDEFSYELGLNPGIHHVPAKGDRGPVIAYYAFYKTKDGDFDFEVAYKDEIEAHRRKYSKAKNSPWNTEFDAMAKKTLLKRVLKFAPVSTEVARQIQSDESIKSFDKDHPDLAKDMTVIPDEMVLEADYEEMPGEDPETGEIKDAA